MGARRKDGENRWLSCLKCGDSGWGSVSLLKLCFMTFRGFMGIVGFQGLAPSYSSLMADSGSYDLADMATM